MRFLKQKGSRSEASRLDLPSISVENVFRDSEHEAELTIGWVRISVGIALFVSGLLVSSETAGLTQGYNLRQFQWNALATVVAFLVLGLTSFFLVVSQRFRPWMAYGLVTCDAIVIGASLYFALNASRLSGNWVVAIPTLWAVPLLLAVGAFRYRPLVQLWATFMTVAAVAGVANATGFNLRGLADAPAVEILSDNIRPLLSLPPYLMRAVMLVLMGSITALAMARSRRLLIRVGNETATRMKLARFLPAEIAPFVGETDAGLWRQGRRQHGIILFVDIRGFTAYAEKLDPARLSIFISSFRRRVMRATEAYGGMVDKFIGDGALIVFGIPEPKSDDCPRAVACAHRILELVDQWNKKRGFDPPVRVGIGIHGGEIYYGLVGDDHRLEFTVLGDTVNVAAKIEQATKRFDAALLASEVVVMNAGQKYVWEPVGREPLGGRGEHVALFAPKGFPSADKERV